MFESVSELAVSPDGRYLFQADDFGGIRIIDLDRLTDPFSATIVGRFRVKAEGFLSNLRLSPTGDRFLLIRKNKPWQAPSADLYVYKPLEFDLLDDSISDAVGAEFLDSARLLVGSPNEITRWNFESKTVEQFRNVNSLAALALDRSKARFWTISKDGQLSQWTLAQFALERQWKTGSLGPIKLTFLPPNRLAVTTGSNIAFWTEQPNGEWVSSDQSLPSATTEFLTSDSGETYTATLHENRIELLSGSEGGKRLVLYGGPDTALAPGVVLSKHALIAMPCHLVSDCRDYPILTSLFEMETGLPLLRVIETSKSFNRDGPRRRCAPEDGVRIHACLGSYDKIVGPTHSQKLTALTAALRYSVTRRSILPVGFFEQLGNELPRSEDSLRRTAGILAKIQVPDDMTQTRQETAGIRQTCTELESLSRPLAKAPQFEQIENLLGSTVRSVTRWCELESIVLEVRSHSSTPEDLAQRLDSLAHEDPGDYRAPYVLVWLWTQTVEHSGLSAAVDRFQQTFHFGTFSQEPGYGCPESFISDMPEIEHVSRPRQ